MPRKKKQEPEGPVSDRPKLEEPLNAALESDAAIDAEAEAVAAASDTFDQASDGVPQIVSAREGVPVSESVSPEKSVVLEETGTTEPDEAPAAEPPGKLERLQKILAQAGIASRRHAEELVTEGRVQVNGKVVTELGSKADPVRDYIRVDGKLLQGSERHRYFMLNKPKGYVTTVSDPEGRPTIMEFFSKMSERLYPVGRLDYLSEGLLLITNDGELANKLTRAASNVEKTYLVKVSGQPSQEDIERLRQGVGIDRDKPGSGRVQTAPAQIRLFRPGKAGGQRGARTVENPWYEVVLIEGRNRELRKMFEEIGHHVEKIRRIGYGPLELDLEPGKIRELDPQEVENLRRAAEGKYRKPKPPESRKREFAPRPQRPGTKPEWKERRGGFKQSENVPDREDRGRLQSRERDFGRPPEFGGRSGREESGRRSERAESSRRPPPSEFRSEPRREFRPGGRPKFRVAENGPALPRRDDRERRPGTGGREKRGKFAQERPYERGERPKPFESHSPNRGFGGGRRPERRPSAAGRENRVSREERPFERSDRPKRFGSRPPGRSFERSERPVRLDRPERFGSRPPNPDLGRSQRPERRRFEGRPQQRTGAGRPFRREQGDQSGREERPRFRGSRGAERTARVERPSRQERGERPSSARPGGAFRHGKGGQGGKQGSARSGGGRRPGSRPGRDRGKNPRP